MQSIHVQPIYMGLNSTFSSAALYYSYGSALTSSPSCSQRCFGGKPFHHHGVAHQSLSIALQLSQCRKFLKYDARNFLPGMAYR
jgi:hypothetical protein